MCWSAEASTVWAVVGLSTSAYALYKNEPKSLAIPLVYFSLMEALQAYTYLYINQCETPQNQIATLLGYLHIAFQPFFIQMASLYFVPEKIRKKVEILVYTFCFASAILMIIQIYPFDWAGHCQKGLRPICGSQLCSVSGNWHIAWELPANGIGNYLDNLHNPLLGAYLSYTLVAFGLPLLYGSWRFTAYHLVMGPIFANLLTNNINEQPAVWCLLSIGFLLIVIKTPIRRYLFVKNYPPFFQDKTL